MDRRHFLSTAAGALVAGQPAGAQTTAGTAAPACPPAVFDSAPCKDLWTHSSGPASQDPSLKLGHPIAILPEVFQPKQEPLVARPPWSEVSKDAEFLNRLYQGYCVLRAMSPDDPRSLIRQTRMHAFYCMHPGQQSPDPNAIQSNVHTNWAFLPWHRAFIYFHEKILASAMNWPGFRLPAWDWETDDAAIPKFFQDLGLPTFLDGTYGRLDKPLIPLTRCAIQAWFLDDEFVGTSTECPAAQGAHAHIHGITVQGAMATMTTAAADPLFYAHHANVDRYWALLQAQRRNRVEGDVPGNDEEAWKAQWFYLYNEHGELVRVSVGQLMDTKALGYFYDPFPELPECHLVPLNITADVISHATKGVAAGLQSIAAGGLTMRQPQAAGQAILGFLSNPTLSEIVDRQCSEGLPLRLVTELDTAKLKAGEPYVLWYQVGTRDRYHPVGSMVILKHEHPPQQPKARIAFLGCLDAGEFRTLSLAGEKEIILSYGHPGRGNDQPFGEATQITDFGLTILHPEGYYDQGRKLLDSLKIRF
jgi:hypothetical protein